ncbi:hypothetical protein S7711_07575 [Stachybotrys chartarum IBT 7711]|uniref:RFX-type winged-helix domain-containing protein n=1 Tax=Stachybotrys chartarum (strain CBS 109288 / IBT 7711) TaxID=1280523 RepID=A0A084APY5_STACB|nr:hypothetical protein S7711_07575 [Stachybotrys chartarum IBT 7711]
MEKAGFTDSAHVFASSWIPGSQGNHKPMDNSPHMTPDDDILLRAASDMQHAAHNYGMMGPNMGLPMNASMSNPADPMSYHQQQHQQHQHYPHPQQQHPQSHAHQHLGRHPLPAAQYAGQQSFTDSNSQGLSREDLDDAESMPSIPSGPVRPSRTTANNEAEMRALFEANKERNSSQIPQAAHKANLVRVASVCSVGKGSVPRGRVYANYASRCATEKITVLNPASFGKLVRVLFPGLKTRRLGVRGESKYHYVNFHMEDEEAEELDTRGSSTQTPTITEMGIAAQDKRAASTQPPRRQSDLPASNSPNRARRERKSRLRKWGRYVQPDVPSLTALSSTRAKVPLELSWNEPNPQASFALPSIEPYLPQGTDPDCAKSLSAAYRAHCTSLLESLRFCREKPFFHHYTSLLGTLTMPVQRLFGNPTIAPWIESCDLALYQSMYGLISHATLQVIPQVVLEFFKNVSSKLVLHIRETFRGQPRHVVQAKEDPASLFASLLARLLRVNLTAHAAANMLFKTENRNEMYMDWIQTVEVRKVAECVPMRAMDDVVNLLVHNIRDLLDPRDIPWELECITVYGDLLLRSDNNRTEEPADNDESDKGVSRLLDRWVTFLRSLPEKFPYASAEDILLFVERVGTAVMRDLTLRGGKSFGSWWVAKTWIDEMVNLEVEQRGFMQQQSCRDPSEPPSQPATSRNDANQDVPSGARGEEANISSTSHSQPGRAPFPTLAGTTSQVASGTDAHDDSGIGIRTPEEEFSMEKFSFDGNDSVNAADGVDLPEDVFTDL